MRKVLLVGNPNCGKTTLFNLLTSGNERVGNWPGVTVAKKQGFCEIDNQPLEIVDLPGVYSLNVDNNSAQDSLITARQIEELDVSVIVNVVDACHLERHLYLTTQLLELEVPIILVVNMIDIAKNKQIVINKELLSKKLDCQVVFMQANKKQGIEELHHLLANQVPKPSRFKLNFGDEINKFIDNQIDKKTTHYKACRALETGIDFGVCSATSIKDADIIMADKRYTVIHEIIKSAQQQDSKKRDNLTAKIDNIVLNRIFALPIFAGIMYLMFLFSINFGVVFRDYFDATTEAIFVKGTASVLTKIHAPDLVVTSLAYGIGRGINTTASFIPVLFIMYLCLSLLESSGYMARASFVIDRIMRLLGLPGKAFVPMIVGFGCNVPGIMATRTLESERDRILTVMMSPFMSCSARLAIYVVFASVFFPRSGQNIVFSLYLVGIMMAVLTGFIFKRIFLFEGSAPLIIELPTYQIPTLNFLLRDTYKRLRVFVLKAGQLIVPICMFLSIMNSIVLPLGNEDISLIAYCAKKLAPLFSPMGISDDNWPAVVGLITGTLAKEVVVGTLNSLYANYGVMAQSFHSSIAAYAYLLFVLLYIPCVSTMAAIKQETNRKYMLFSIAWSIVLAYIVASSFYQAANIIMTNHWGYYATIIFSLLIAWLITYIWRKRNAMSFA